MSESHLSPAQLDAHLSDELDPAQAATAGDHLAHCAECRTLLEAARAAREATAPGQVQPPSSVQTTMRVPVLLQMAGNISYATDPAILPHQVRFNPTPGLDKTEPGAPAFQPAMQVSRYVLVRMAGRGGMGDVYVAYDPQLDRRVALKLLRPEASRTDGLLRARLLREAQAMARLTHPNVVAVHDAGEWGEQVYLAMEYVEGPTLAEWASREGRTWREILDEYLSAGRGLAAAHAAGLVHRDFKPDNVLVARDGRPKVTDFGLAHVEGRNSLEPSAAPPTDVALTADGAFIGTPAYMSPEQLEGKPATVRSDQFSFCAALYEALYGERPYPGEDVATIAASLKRGEIQPAPRGTPVPAWVRVALVRGLALDPEARHPSMEALLAALEADPSRRRSQLVQRAALAAVVAAGLGAAGWSVQREHTRCSREAAAAVARWQLPARPQQEPLAGILDAYRGKWVAMHQAVCEDVRAGALPADTGALRLRCLDDHGLLVGAAVALGTGADGIPAERLQSQLDGKWSPSSCAKLDSPKHHALEERARFASELGRVEALAESGDPARARKAALELETQAAAAGARTAQAESILDRAELLLVHGKELEEAVNLSVQAALLAQSAGDDALAARARASQLKLLAVYLQKNDEAEKALPEVRAAIERAGNPPEEVSTLDRALGYLALAKHDRGGTEYFEKALAAIREAYGPETPLAAPILSDVADAKVRLDRDPGAAATAFLDAAALVKPVGQVERQNLLILKANAMSTLVLAGEAERAEGVANQTRPLAEQSEAAGPVDACAFYLNAADIELELGQLGAAARDLEHAAKLLTQGDATPDIVESLEALRARLALAQGDLATAAPHAEAAVKAGADPACSPEDLADAKLLLARSLERTDAPRARALANEALRQLRDVPMPLYLARAKDAEALLKRLR